MKRSWILLAVAMVIIAMCTPIVHGSDIDTDNEAEVVMDRRGGGRVVARPAAPRAAARAVASPVKAVQKAAAVAQRKPAPTRAKGKAAGRVAIGPKHGGLKKSVPSKKQPLRAAGKRAGAAPQGKPTLKKAGKLAAQKAGKQAKTIASKAKILAAKATGKAGQAIKAAGRAVAKAAKKAAGTAKAGVKAAAKAGLNALVGAKGKLAGKKAKAAAKTAAKKAKTEAKGKAKAAAKGKKAGAKGKKAKAAKGKKSKAANGKKAAKGKKSKAGAKGKKSKAGAKGKKGKKGAKKAGAKGKKALKNKKALRLTGKALTDALRRVGRRAFQKGKQLGWPIAKIRTFVREQISKFRSRHQPTPANKVADPKLKKMIGGVAKKQTRESISKLQAALKKKKAGSVELPIKHHKITIHPRTPAPKKVKIHKPGKTDKNYVKHLEQSKDAWRKKIATLENAIHQLKPREKHDWEVEYGTLDPPDAGKAAMAAELLSDLKPFLKDAVSIKQAELEEGRENLVTMEALRWEVHDKLTKARSQPLLPEMYRFIE